MRPTRNSGKLHRRRVWLSDLVDAMLEELQHRYSINRSACIRRAVEHWYRAEFDRAIPPRFPDRIEGRPSDGDDEDQR